MINKNALRGVLFSKQNYGPRIRTTDTVPAQVIFTLIKCLQLISK